MKEHNKEHKKMRSGYTTGTCAAAAAWAAVRLLCGGIEESMAEAAGPNGRIFTIPVFRSILREGKWAACSVKKDAGDDPDVTNGILVCARAVLTDKIPDTGSCYTLDRYRDIFLTGGEGIGIVTKKGLSCPVGYYAINPVPREMILGAADKARHLCGQPDRRLLIEISIPEGAKLAVKTFNPTLGIVGGISVLGSTGIVNPMSEAALIETIRLDIRVRAAEGKRILAVAPGNYGERFLRDELGLDMGCFVKCSNFVGDTFHMMRDEGIEAVLLAGHMGKLIKVAGGVMNTHSRYGDRRMEILRECALEAGLAGEAAEEILRMNTTEEAAEYLDGLFMLTPAAALAAERVKINLEAMAGVRTEVVLFTGAKGLTALTKGASWLACFLK